MARGWESKSVESQIQDAEMAKEGNGPPGRKEMELDARRRSIERSRRRVARELEATQSDLRRASLELALKHLDNELSKLVR